VRLYCLIFALALVFLLPLLFHGRGGSVYVSRRRGGRQAGYTCMGRWSSGFLWASFSCTMFLKLFLPSGACLLYLSLPTHAFPRCLPQQRHTWTASREGDSLPLCAIDGTGVRVEMFVRGAGRKLLVAAAAVAGMTFAGRRRSWRCSNALRTLSSPWIFVTL